MNWKFWQKKEIEKKAESILSEEELKVIQDYALGDDALKDQAIEIYYKGLDNGLHWYSSPEMGYMDEITNVCPCHVMRAQHKEKIEEKVKLRKALEVVDEEQEGLV